MSDAELVRLIARVGYEPEADVDQTTHKRLQKIAAELEGVITVAVKRR